MDYFEKPRYKINKILLGMVGQWPYQKKCESRFFLTLLLIFSSTCISAQVRKVMVEDYSVSIMLEAIPPFLVDIICATNLISCIINSDKFYELLERIEEDGTKSVGHETKIIEQYADEGRTVIVYYSAWLYSCMALFLLLPIIPKVIVVCGFANISAPAQFPFPVDFYIDSEKNYFYLQMEVCTSVTFLITLIVSTDALFVMFVQHVCGVLASICYRLENMIEDESLEVDLHPDRAADEHFFIISDCIKKHKKAFEFAELLDLAYTWSFFFQIGVNIIALTFTAVQLVTSIGEPDEVIRQALLSGAELLHLFFECFFSQRLTDHTLLVFEALNKTKWYKTSIRSRKLLSIMLMRSLKPYELRAGRIYTMSMENYNGMIRTSMSYFTVLGSVQ